MTLYINPWAYNALIGSIFSMPYAEPHEGTYPECMVRERESKWSNDEMKERLMRGSEEGRKHRYVSCWTMQDPESFAMWKIYTPNSKGIAIQSTNARLANCFVRKPNDFFEGLNARIERVEYDLNEIKNMPKEDDFERFQLISIPTVEKPEIGLESKVDLNVLFKKIYLSHRLGDGLERFVKDLLKECNMKKMIVKPSFVRIPMY